MYHAPTAAASGTLAFTGAALDSGWLLVAAVTMLFAGLALRKLAPARRKGEHW